MIEFNSTFEAEKSENLSKLVHFNQGVFKSEKQAKFLLNTYFTKSSADFTNEYGVVIKAGQYISKVEYVTRWADYGSRSVIPGVWIYIADENGILAKWKGGYNGNMRDGAYPNPEKVQLKWSRPESMVFTPKEAKKEESTVKSEYIGTIGKRQNFVGVITNVRGFYSSSTFGYYDSGYRTVTTIATDEGIVVYWNSLSVEGEDLQKGAKVQFSASVKSHGEYENVKQTTVTRATKVAVVA